MTERDDRLLEFASERQREIAETVWDTQSFAAAARQLGIDRSAVSRAMSLLRAKAAQHGYAPDHDMVNPAPPGFKYKGVSTLRDKRSGEAVLQWEKTTADDEARQQALREAMDAAAETLPRLRPVRPPAATVKGLLAEYVVTDAHIDMLSWPAETGEKWDIKISEDMLTRGLASLIAGAQPASDAILVFLGDFMHSDGMDAVTPQSGHQLDRDTRFQRSVHVALRTMRRAVDMALAKHDTVRVLIAEGNHDPVASIWLRSIFAALYENDERVTVDTSPNPYYVHQHGDVMLAYHHGHLKRGQKFAELVAFFAAQFAETWGQTRYRYGASGHLHHHHEVDHSGMLWRQHFTMAAKDAYAARAGYVAQRGMRCTIYHDRFGEVASNVVRPEMVALGETPAVA